MRCARQEEEGKSKDEIDRKELQNEEMTLRSEDLYKAPPASLRNTPNLCVILDVASDSCLNGRKEVFFANL